MKTQAEKMKLMELLLITDSELILKKVRFFFEDVLNDGKISQKKTEKKKLRKNTKGLSFNWEGGLKEMKNEFNGVSLQHHINSLRK